MTNLLWDCSNCGSSITCQSRRTFEPDKSQGWKGNLDEYYCAICGEFLWREDMRVWIGDKRKTPRWLSYGPEKIEIS